MPTGSAHIPPARRSEFACALAGLLAEAGIQHVQLTRGGVTQSLHARTTDLPGQLLHGNFTLTAPGLTIEQTADLTSWSTNTPPLAEALTRATDLLP